MSQIILKKDESENTISDDSNDGMIELSLADFPSICRVCLQNSDLNKINSILIEDNDTSLINLIKDLTELEIQENDDLPQHICNECAENFYKYFLFIEQFRKNDLLLRKVVEHYTIEDDKEGENIQVEELAFDEINDNKANIKKVPMVSQDSEEEEETQDNDFAYKCESCDAAFNTLYGLTRHTHVTQHGNKKIKINKCNIRGQICEICGKGFLRPSSLQSHMELHTRFPNIGNTLEVDKNLFKCNQCTRSFKRLPALLLHQHRTHASAEDKTTKPRPADDQKNFTCEKCNKRFASKTSLKSHIRIHSGIKPFVCPVCERCFSHVGSLDTHMLIHTGERPHQCTICKKRFTQAPHLKYHERTHTGEKPFVCPYCGKRFASKGNMTVHERTHTGEQPYVCDICNRGFYDSSSMKKHSKTHDLEMKEETLEAILIV